MGNFREKAAGTINTFIPPYSAPGILLRSLYSRNCKYINTMHARHLTDIDVLNERIEYIKSYAQNGVAPLKFYMINLHSVNAGLFSLVLNAMSHIIFPLAEGTIPVIDMRYSRLYLDEEESGKVNAWEKYFKQPCGYGPDDIGDNACTSRQIPNLLSHVTSKRRGFYTKHLQLWSALFDNFFKLNDECAEYIEQEYSKLIKPGMRVLGVACRGTDYTKMRMKGCYVQPRAEDIISKVKEVMPEWGCDYVYVKSEEREVVKLFESAFPGRVLTISQRYYDEIDADYSQNYVGRMHFDRENDTFLKGLEYLSSIIILSRCTSLVMGIASGSLAALYINGGKFENTYLFDLGVYS